MNETPVCPKCGASLPPDAPSGLCPKCLVQAGLESEVSSDPRLGPTVNSPAPSGFEPPAVEELAQLFPQLEILELLGKGGMGAVYKARQRGLDRFVALKILPPEVGHDPAFAERFTREARALAKLNHPHIVAVYDFGQAGKPEASAPGALYYFIMEYVDGANLRQTMQAGRLKPEEALAIVPQICDALQYAHDEGVVHRDVKPENILLDTRGRVKIADFGLSKLLREDRPELSLTGTHQVMGTIRYMAPEQMQGTKRVDHRADIYSLGVVFYELLTGDLPMGRFDPPSQKVQIDVRLDEVVLRALEQEPDKRYQRASDVKTDVEGLTPRAVLTQATRRDTPIGRVTDDGHSGWDDKWITVSGIVVCVLGIVSVCGMWAFVTVAYDNGKTTLLQMRGISVWQGTATAVNFGLLGLLLLATGTLRPSPWWKGAAMLFAGTAALTLTLLGWQALENAAHAAAIVGLGDPLEIASNAQHDLTMNDMTWKLTVGLSIALLLLGAVDVRSVLGRRVGAVGGGADRAKTVESHRDAAGQPLRPKVIGVLAVANLLIGLVLLSLGALMLLRPEAGDRLTELERSVNPYADMTETYDRLVTPLYFVTTVAFFASAIGLLLYQPWARKLTIAVSVFELAMLGLDLPMMMFDSVAPPFKLASNAEYRELMGFADEAEAIVGAVVLVVLLASMLLAAIGFLIAQIVILNRPHVKAALTGDERACDPRTSVKRAAVLLLIGGIASGIMALVMVPETYHNYVQGHFTLSGSIIRWLALAVFAALAVVVIRGSLKMLSLEDHSASRRASLCSLFSLFGIITLPAGIYALIVLGRPEAKAAVAPEQPAVPAGEGPPEAGTSTIDVGSVDGDPIVSATAPRAFHPLLAWSGSLLGATLMIAGVALLSGWLSRSGPVGDVLGHYLSRGDAATQAEAGPTSKPTEDDGKKSLEEAFAAGGVPVKVVRFSRTKWKDNFQLVPPQHDMAYEAEVEFQQECQMKEQQTVHWLPWHNPDLDRGYGIIVGDQARFKKGEQKTIRGCLVFRWNAGRWRQVSTIEVAR